MKKNMIIATAILAITGLTNLAFAQVTTSVTVTPQINIPSATGVTTIVYQTGATPSAPWTTVTANPNGSYTLNYPLTLTTFANGNSAFLSQGYFVIDLFPTGGAYSNESVTVSYVDGATGTGNTGPGLSTNLILWMEAVPYSNQNNPSLVLNPVSLNAAGGGVSTATASTGSTNFMRVNLGLATGCTALGSGCTSVDPVGASPITTGRPSGIYNGTATISITVT